VSGKWNSDTVCPFEHLTKFSPVCNSAGLEAYARIMSVSVKHTNLPTWVIAPPSDANSLENPSLLLKIHPDKAEPFMITPDEWLGMISDMSDVHCKKAKG
jgi:hypothetical protein